MWSSWLGRIALLGLLLMAVIVVALTPRGVRERRRSRRLSGGPEAIWEELRASAIDLGVPWRDGRSPRQVGDDLVSHFGSTDPASSRTGPASNPEARDALHRIVSALELHRYARPGVLSDDQDDLLDAGTAVIGALAAGRTRRERRRATWLPRTWTRRSTVAAEAEAAERQPEPVG